MTSPEEITDPVEWVRQWILADREAAQIAGIIAPGPWLHNHKGAPGVIYAESDGRELATADEPLRAVTEHLVRHDAEDVIAQCDAALAILDEHAPEDGGCRICTTEQQQVYWDGENETTPWEKTRVTAPCRTVRLLVSGYRHRPGWREEWGA